MQVVLRVQVLRHSKDRKKEVSKTMLLVKEGTLRSSIATTFAFEDFMGRSAEDWRSTFKPVTPSRQPWYSTVLSVTVVQDIFQPGLCMIYLKLTQ